MAENIPSRSYISSQI